MAISLPGKAHWQKNRDYALDKQLALCDSSLQLQRKLELGSYRTALFMTHRIRYALKDPSFNDKLSGTVEVDETYIGGKICGMGHVQNKLPLVSLLERGGRVRS